MSRYNFKESLIVGLMTGVSILLAKPILDLLDLPQDGWHQYPTMIGLLVIFHGAFYLVRKTKQKDEP